MSEWDIQTIYRLLLIGCTPRDVRFYLSKTSRVRAALRFVAGGQA